jgi:hypothetical protein
METKKCTKCHEEKSKGEFFKSPRNKNGFRSQCKVCENKANLARQSKYSRTEYYQSDVYKEVKRNYYKNNSEKILIDNAAWRQTLKGRLLSYKIAAKKRNIEWSLTDEEFESFWQKPCTYCGDEIKTVGIDRLENDKGYYLENCTSCCSTCNTMKLAMTKTEFIEKIKIILINLKEKL